MKYPSPTASRADLTLATDYYPFGSAMPGRSFSAGEYRFGWQGSEKENESAGDANIYSTFYRMLDVRVGRWLSVYPVFKANESPFAAFGNSPLFYIDKNGQDTLVVHSQ